MTNAILCLLVSILCCVNLNYCQEIDYYWRDYYHGKVPSDAFPAGKDASGNDTYIGQAYLYGYGNFVGQIFPAKKHVKVPCTGKYLNSVYQIKNAIKILCSQHMDNLYWVPTTAKTFHRDIVGTHVVVGGYNGKKEGNYAIGRVMYDGLVRIGGVIAYKLEHAHLHFPLKDDVEKIDSYEVLVYNKTDSVDAIDQRKKFQVGAV